MVRLHNIGAHFATEHKNVACSNSVAEVCKLLFGRTGESCQEVKEKVDRILDEEVFQHFATTRKLLKRINEEREKVVVATRAQAEKKTKKRKRTGKTLRKRRKRKCAQTNTEDGLKENSDNHESEESDGQE